ncbi:acetyl-CoA synthetase-like protein [Dothidotthia symphoricarpi CBS 119687]|uniref:Acetyl-CoA synthetase-like protein n=1 Tax=Dothidotthia symphoricarpi CBS 119687 TaxID=1392245 RepID=A0A6A6A3T1_9PLEO|nr:acetyl-CoA synthetase-like protein [Dothidotthia symphoricarpi CBS 119687]KAF2126672.1 acetyl-CoA synthetase-like protein [Dothidotthia symphoricarpi CBS 119687]
MGVLEQLTGKATQAPPITLNELSSVCPQDLDTIWQRNQHLPALVNERVHDIISSVASQRPEALAIHSWDGQLTYGELDRLSTLLAHELMSSSVRPGSFVPLLFEKSLWASVSMIGVIKAGAAFVPLDAEHPEGRLRAVMQSLKSEIILCSAQTRDLAARLAPDARIVGTSLTDECSRIGHNAIVADMINSQPSDLAYAVFTSGSTGIPKGVRITHANLASVLRYQPETLGFQSTTRSLDSSSYSFDAGIFNLFYTLVQGGCLCVPSDNSRKGDLGAFMREYKVNLAQLTPSVVRSMDPASLPDLKHLILTGEPLTQGDITTWAPHLCLVNVYGPTECTIMCSAASDVASSSKAYNIGRGLGANLWLTKLNRPMDLCPVGGIGEILIEGPLVGAGYVGKENEDHPSLVVNPPWLVSGTTDQPGRHGRLFRTGDMGKYADDGTIVYIGRIGSEVKLRSQRVNLAEVEDNLRRTMPQDMELAAEVVSMRWGPKNLTRQILLSFVSHAHDHDTSVLEERLQELGPKVDIRLGKALAAYLKPEAFVSLPRMPKTSSQKTDRLRLKEIGARLQPSQLIWIGGNQEKVSRTPPATQMERDLASFWAEILGLGLESIGQEDSFFRLGGDSIGVMRLTTIAHKNGFSVTAKDVFKSPQLS